MSLENPLPEDAGASLVRQSSAVSADGGPAQFDAKQTASAKKKKKKKTESGQLSYKQMMAATMTHKTTDERIAEHRARLVAKIDTKDTRVTAAKFERI